MVPGHTERRQCRRCRPGLHGRVQALADWLSDRRSPGREPVGHGPLVGRDYGHGICGRGVVQDDAAGGDPVGGRDGHGAVWDFQPVRWGRRVG